MSFGFRKKISNITPKKKKKHGYTEEEMVTESSKPVEDVNDKNGNFGKYFFLSSYVIFVFLLPPFF